MIDRRTVILAVVGGLLAAPFATHAQEPTKAWHIAFLSDSTRPADGAPAVALQQALVELGYVDGKNVTYLGRWSDTKFDWLETDVANYKATIVMLEAGPQPENQVVAIAPPSIQIIDPPIVIPRDTATVRVRGGPNKRTVVGRVTAPAGLLSFTANDVLQEVDADGYFKTSVELTGGESRVTMVAVDRQGKRAQLELLLQEDGVIGKSLGLGKSYALVIGNQKYQKLAQLTTPETDATDIATLLKDRYGFTVSVLLNATRSEMLKELKKMRVLVTEKDNLLIYYAGHGQLDRVNLHCYWLPIDADPASTANWIATSMLTEDLNMFSARHILVVAESCYSTAVTHGSIGQLEPGLSDEARRVWLKSIADSPSRTVLTSGGMSPVLDGGGAKHSVFAQNFIDILAENQDVLPGKQLSDVLSARVLDVARRMNFQQRPEYAPIGIAGDGSGVSGDFIFAPSLSASQAALKLAALELAPFPWPPPAASAEHQIRNAWVTKGEHTRLSDVAARLEAALEAADYERWRYSSVPRGFALVTQLEQIKPDGTPRPGRERFRTDLPSLSDLSFVEFLKALAKAPSGYYRVIVFMVTDIPFSQAERKPTEGEARHWLNAGLNQLPKPIGALAYGEDHRTTALIYEFKRSSKEEPATFVLKSLESGRTHLEKARIWDALTR